MINKDHNITERVDKEILALLPDHHYWHGKPYHFHYSNIDYIFQQLGNLY